MCNAIYFPIQFFSVILAGVYTEYIFFCITEANALYVEQMLFEQITQLDDNHPNSPLTILGEFNHKNKEQQKYKKLIYGLTIDRKTRSFLQHNKRC